jgi:hypothetical protein
VIPETTVPAFEPAQPTVGNSDRNQTARLISGQEKGVAKMHARTTTATSVPADSRFAEAESDVDRGTSWRFREADAPNPLTIMATEWSTGVTKLGEAEWLNGVDRDGKAWSVLVGSVVLRKRLIEGLVEEWDDEARDFVVVEMLERVQPGEVVSIKYLGDVEGARYTYPNFRVSRKPPIGSGDKSSAQGATVVDDIPFR